MRDWSKIIRFRDIDDVYGSFHKFKEEHFPWRRSYRTNCGFLQIFEIPSRTHKFEPDPVKSENVELIFAFGPTDDGNYGGDFDLTRCIRSIFSGKQKYGFGDWWQKLYIHINPDAKFGISDAGVKAEGAKWIKDNCAFRYFDVGRKSNLWEYCQPTENKELRFVPDSFFTYGEKRPIRAKIYASHPQNIDRSGNWDPFEPCDEDEDDWEES